MDDQYEKRRLRAPRFVHTIATTLLIVIPALPRILKSSPRPFEGLFALYPLAGKAQRGQSYKINLIDQAERESICQERRD
jgi:hypothetical protein